MANDAYAVELATAALRDVMGAICGTLTEKAPVGDYTAAKDAVKKVLTDDLSLEQLTLVQAAATELRTLATRAHRDRLESGVDDG